MRYNKKMEYHIRLQYVVGEIGHKSIQSLCRKVARTKGHSDFRTLLNDPFLISQIHHLRGVKNVCDLDNQKMMNVITERQWYSLYMKTDKQTGCCRVVPREDVDKRLDIPLVHKLMKYVFLTSIHEDILKALDVLLQMKEEIDRGIYIEKRMFEEMFEKSRGSLKTIACYVGTDIKDLETAKHIEIQELVDENLGNFLKLRMLLKDPAERILRSTMNVSLSRAGFEDREEMFENPFVQSELSRKAAIWSNKRGCHRGQRSFEEEIFHTSGHVKSLKQSVKQCLGSFDFDFLYKLFRDISVLNLELTPYTNDGIFSFIKTLREIYGLVMRGCPDNKIETSDFRKYWKSSKEALEVLLRFIECSNKDQLSLIEMINFDTVPLQCLQRSEVEPVIFRVQLEFPPDELTMYEYSRFRITDALREHDESERTNHYLPQFDNENFDLIFVHHKHDAAKQTCEEFFNVYKPLLTEFDPCKIQGSDTYDKKNPVVCLVDPNFHQMSSRCEYLGVIDNTTLAEIKEMAFTESKFTYFLDAHFCSEDEKRPLYNAMKAALKMKVLSVIEIAKRQNKSNKLINILERHNKNLTEKRKGMFNMTSEFNKWLCSLMPSVIGRFTVTNTVKIYYKEGFKERLLCEIMDREFAEKSDLEFVQMNHLLTPSRLFRPGEAICPGGPSPRQGSITLYGMLQSNSKHVAISLGHVIQKGQTAYIKKGNVKEELGMAIHPPENYTEMFPGELSIVEITNETIKSFLENAEQDHKTVDIFEEDIETLYGKKVVKYGAGSGRTVGYIVATDFHVDVCGDVCKGILIEEQANGAFARPGDSGALVYIPGRKHITAISLVFGEVSLPNHMNMILTAKFHDYKTAFERRSNDVIEIKSDHGLSEM